MTEQLSLSRLGGGQLLTAIQKLKEGFSIRKLDTALEKQGAVLSQRRREG